MDAQIVAWLNQGVGKLSLVDAVMKVIVSDYLIPVSASLVILGLWFWGSDAQARLRNQLTTITGSLAVGFANWGIHLINGSYFRVRPFENQDLLTLFYHPTDSSFPANATAVAFGIATAVFMTHRWTGVGLYIAGLLWGFSRVYFGVHYPTDVLAGAGVGIGAALLALVVIRLGMPIIQRVLRIAQYAYVA